MRSTCDPSTSSEPTLTEDGAAGALLHPQRACVSARAEIGRIVACDDTVRDRPSLQRHLDECASCKERYREAVMTAARIGRRARLERDASRPSRLAALERGFWSFEPARVKRLRMLWLPLLVFLFVFHMFPETLGAPRVTVGVLSGSLQIGRRSFDAGDDSETVRTGRACTTDAGGRAVFRLADADLTLMPSSRLVLENGAAARFRLERGALEARGTCTLMTSFGVVELSDAAASLRESGEGFVLESRSGRVRVVNALGPATLAPGERVQIVQGDTRPL